MTDPHTLLRDLLDQAHRHLQAISADGHDLIRRGRIPAARDGWPARHGAPADGPSALPPGDPDQPSSWPPPPHNDPVGEAAVAPQPRDPVRAAMHQMLRALHHAVTELARAQQLTARPRHDGADGEPGCQSCARTTRSDGTPRWEPPYTRRPSDCGGRLPEAQHLCRWCWDAVAQLGRLPTRAEVAAHHEGRRLRRPA